MPYALVEQFDVWGTNTALLLTPEGALIEPSTPEEITALRNLIIKETDNAKLSKSQTPSL